MKTTKCLSFSISLGLLLCIAPLVQAQVTIGSGTEPNPGALLDLKQDGTTTKGLGMPRVALTDVSKLQPMYTYVDAANIPTSTDLAAHTGLTVYNVNQCLKEASGIATGAGPFVWDGVQWQALLSDAAGVIRHPAKAGVYEAFTSANFGTAGRWMTANLAATAYDGINHSTFGTAQARILSPMPSGYTTYDYDKAYWAYPNVDGVGNPQLATEYNKKKSLGYLYTWNAATAGKGGTTGHLNIGNTLGSAASNNEATYPENTTTVQVVNQQQRIQGICPVGWHLPSDYEWTQLQAEFTTSKNKYSSISSIVATDNGTAMKDVCENFLAPGVKGASRIVSQGGFSALLAGNAFSGNSSGLGANGYFWSSSSGGDDHAWIQAMYSNNAAVSRFNSNRANLFSVRCKKDTP